MRLSLIQNSVGTYSYEKLSIMYFIQVHYFSDAHVSRKLCKSPSLSPVINNIRKYYFCIVFSKYSLDSRIFQIKMFPQVLILPKISK